jgi:hypothetical protein
VPGRFDGEAFSALEALLSSGSLGDARRAEAVPDRRRS